MYLLFHLSTDFGHLAERIIRSIDIDPRQHFLHRIVGALELVEGIGLWLDQLWAVIATSLVIPLELYELAIRPSLSAGGILVNVLIVLYLASALRRRLTARSR